MKAKEYTIFLKAKALRTDRPDGEGDHIEIHFVTATTDDEALKEAHRLIRKLSEWDASWLRRLVTVLRPDEKIIYSSPQKGER